MQRYVIAPVAEIPPGTHKVFTVAGRPIGIFNLDGEFYGLLNRCPHQGGSLCDGLITGLAVGDRPGEFRMIRKGEMVRCPWSGGSSIFAPASPGASRPRCGRGPIRQRSPLAPR